MAIKNKETLKNYFKKGGVVSEKHFIDLIDSSMNVIDDGISVDPKNGLRINPTGIFTTLISFSKKNLKKRQISRFTQIIIMLKVYQLIMKMNKP